jgi:hypothetical protein
MVYTLVGVCRFIVECEAEMDHYPRFRDVLLFEEDRTCGFPHLLAVIRFFILLIMALLFLVLSRSVSGLF